MNYGLFFGVHVITDLANEGRWSHLCQSISKENDIKNIKKNLVQLVGYLT